MDRIIMAPTHPLDYEEVDIMELPDGVKNDLHKHLFSKLTSYL